MRAIGDTRGVGGICGTLLGFGIVWWDKPNLWPWNGSLYLQVAERVAADRAGCQ